MICKKLRRMVEVVFAIILFCAASSPASAEIIEDIKLHTDENGEVDVTIKFTVPIQKLRYFPAEKSRYLVVYFNILYNVSRDQWQDYESHRSPPSDLIVGFNVTTRDLNTGPKIEIEFNRPAEYRLTAGRDNRTIKIHIKPDALQSKQGKPAPVLSGGVITPPVAAPAIAAAPAAALAATVTAPITAAPKSALPGVPATAPKPSSAQLGGKDGLPVFPQIEKVTQVTGDTQPSGDLSLADQIKKTNSEAAVLMAKGRDALLAGEMFSAIEAFNNTLKLPPNKYSPDAQLWIGIAREKTGQQAKAKLEYESYLKLYPDGTETKWVKDRLARLNAIQPSPSPLIAKPAAVTVQNLNYQTTLYGSYSMYYYHGASHTDSIATVGAVQSPSSLTVTDQSSLITNISMTAHSFNGVNDNRIVFQDFFAANFLPGQKNTNRLDAAFYEFRNRGHDLSARIGRQSAMGGGVLGRFDGVSGGVGFLQDWRANAVAGQLSDMVVGDKPKFYGASMDFGIRSPFGGTLYAINQKVGEISDRKAIGGNLRYFDPRKTAIAMVDYDTQFRDLNIVTLQATLNGESGTDYNFLFDLRKTPSLSLRSAVNGTPASIDILLQNGWTQDDLVALAKQRTATSNTAQFGVTSHIKEKWQVGTDFIVSNTSGMPASGTLNPDGTTGLEGFVPATPSTGNAWTLSERLIGSDVYSSRDVSMFSVSLTRSPLMTGKSVLLNSHAYFREIWTLDTTLRLYWQNDNTGNKQSVISPMLKLGYRVKSYLTLETEGGIEWTKVTSSTLDTSKINRKYFSLGFRWDY
jgi:TolA-binding protein